MMKGGKLLAGFLVTVLFAVTPAQAAFADAPSIPITEGVVNEDIDVTKPFSNDGVSGVVPSSGNVELNGNLTITMESQEGDAPLTPPRVIGVNNDSTGNAVSTKNIVITAPAGSVGIGVIEDGGKTVVDGSITAGTYGIEFNDDYGFGENAGRVICTGTVSGGTAAINLAEGAELPGDAIVVYQLAEGTKGLVTINGEEDENDGMVSQINYIIKKSFGADAITFGQDEVTQIEGYDTAHYGDTIHVKLAAGYEFGSSSTVKAELQADGSYLVTIPKTGGVTLSAILKAVTVASESGSSAPATTKKYTQEQLDAAVRKFGGVLVKSLSELQAAAAGGAGTVFVTGEMLKDPAAQQMLLDLLKTGKVKAYKVFDDGEIMSAAVNGAALAYENCGSAVESAKFNPSGNSAAAIFSNSFTKTEGKAAGIRNISMTNNSMTLNVPVENLTNGGSAAMKLVSGNGEEAKLVADNIAVPSLTEEGAGGTAIGQENIQVNIVNSKAGNSRLTIKLPGGKGTGAVNLKVNGITLNHGEADTNNDGTWLPVETYLPDEGGVYTYYKGSTDGT